MPRTAIPAPRHPAEPTAPPVERMLLTVEEAAAAIGVGRSLMYELIAAGAVETVRVGRLRRVRPEALHDYVASLSQ
ncbi:excisionase family DNA-binding protein [Sporichthya polymorpha]|uniref:excisionase family DNA-binding protein n=1 Tax=Sporichthya polymorpha TaxID=35751 RepID=UPI0003612DD8|nr:excisionase family DNA-binding protein [Sporichthya polymorpha]